MGESAANADVLAVDNVSPRLTFWQRPRVQQVLPFATSLLVHLAVIGVGVLLYKAAAVVMHVATREQIVIPDTNLVENADTGGMPNPGINDDPTRAVAQNADESVRASDDWAEKKSATLARNLMAGSADVAADVTPIGAGSVTGGAVTGLKPGLGEAGGNLAPFGPPGGGAGQGKGLFGIPGGNVRRVAYVCDASGSLFGTRALALIKNELRESIGKLRAGQAFSVLFFRGTDVEPIVLNDAKGVLQTVNPKSKEAAYTLIEQIEVRGDTDPTRALKMAFAMQPQPEMVFLLVDGVASTVVTPADLEKLMRQLNAAKKVRLQVIVVGAATEVELKPFNDLSRANGGGDVRRVKER